MGESGRRAPRGLRVVASSSPHPGPAQGCRPAKVTVALFGTGVLGDVDKVRPCSTEGALML